jgi:ubiquinol-cytochrome c reductase cytochrome b subunit
MALKLRDWAMDRATVGPATYQAVNRGLPKGIGWPQTLGSTTLMLLALQAITGFLLAVYYSPHPDAAYETTRYIDHALPMGRLIHGIHHYATDALVIVMTLHLLRTYVHAAYKAPRELVWILGIVLFTLVLGFSFTGSLLPWDQKAYWDAQVRTQIAGGIPIVGPMMQTLARGGAEVGALTITRFSALHMLLLPALLLPALGAHVLLHWRKGPTPPGVPVGEKTPYVGRFVEHQLYRDALAMLVVFSVIYALAVFHPVDLEFKANPADSYYHPRPEWYFLSLFQFVADWNALPGLGKLGWIAAAVIPGLAMLFLTLAPWIDRGPERSWKKRPLMMGALALGAAGLGIFTYRAVSRLTPNATPQYSLYGQMTDGGERELDPAQVAAGKAAFQSHGCSGCHKAYSDYTTGAKVDLSGYGRRTFLTEVAGHPEVSRLPFYQRFTRYIRGDIRPPNTGMPKYNVEQLPTDQLNAIGAYLSQDPRQVQVQRANPRSN